MMPMTCPSCGAEMPLEVCIAHEEMREAAYEIMKLELPEGALLLRYVSLFRPAKNKMRPAKTVQLIRELLPLMRGSQPIKHKGSELAVPMEVWRSGLEAMLAKADAGKLSLPLTSHGYLFTILGDLVEKYEAALEREREEQRKHGPRSGANVGLQHVSERPIDPELEKIKSAKADPMPAAVREQFNALKKGNKP